MPPDLPPDPPARRLVLFADGTGNAFGGQPSNIWRLYEALEPDTASGAQLARYIPGVGTAALAPLRMIDGATGLGVPGNVRELYRFLCWNWTPGTEIWMFGFSRGAFTLRALAGMIQRQGLMPRVIPEGAGLRQVTSAEMKRNVKGAWRAYREQTAPFRKEGRIQMSPTILLARTLRNAYIAAKRRLLGQMTQSDVTAVQPADRAPGAVTVQFMGLFDTVEAYGLPVEELRVVVDRFLWPISFRNRVCSGIVQRVRHALSLDDERRTFHPIRFDQTHPGPDIREVWFAGVHSDVGGGYPDDRLARDPLVWMAEEAVTQGLQLNPAVLARHSQPRSGTAPIHDSRSGLAAAYRYAPRPVERGPAYGGDPVLHGSVVAKIRAGADGYAPLMLSAPFTAPGSLPAQKAPDITAARALAFWRRVVSMALIGVVLALLAFPFGIEVILLLMQGADYRPPVAVPWLRTLAGLAPGLARPWVDSFAAHPVLSLPLFGAGVGFYLANGTLRDRIKDRALLAWGGGPSTAAPALERGLVRLGQALRGSRVLARAHDVFARGLAPLALGLILAAVLVKGAHVAGMAAVTASGQLCPPGGVTDPPADGTAYVAPALFSSADLCWPVGVAVRQGQRYRIEMVELQPVADCGIPVPLRGFETDAPAFVLGKLVRRTGAHWLQPIAQIGRRGDQIIPLTPVQDARPAFKPRSDFHGANPFACPAPPPSAGPVQRLQAEFTAQADGPLYLYVNDALPALRALYRNNTGAVRIELREMGRGTGF